MADHGFDDADTPRRLRRGPPPRLYVIARSSPIPWLRVRRLGEADRAALLAHFGRLAKAALPGERLPPEAAGIAALCAGLDFGRVPTHGAIAGNAVIAAACALPGPHGPEVVATEEPDYRGRGLGAMLASQVLGQAPGGGAAVPPCAGAAEPALLRLLRSIGTVTGPETGDATGTETATATATGQDVVLGPDLAQSA